MKNLFRLFSALFLCLCFGVLFIQAVTNDPGTKIGALFFTFFALMHYLFFDLSKNAKK